MSRPIDTHRTDDGNATGAAGTAIRPSTTNAGRRQFLQGMAGLTLAVGTDRLWAMTESSPLAGPGQAGQIKATGSFEPNAFVRIGTDNTVTVISKHLEMGQGAYTGLATLVADEMDADWSQVRVESAAADAKRYNNLHWGPAQGTGGSTAMANSWEQMRKAGAAARHMLRSAAALTWGVPSADIQIANGVISHAASRRQATFGQMAVAASLQSVPENPTLKKPEQFVYIGRHVPRKDSADKVKGKARFTQDVQLPGMLVAVVAHPPRFGGVVARVDDSATLAIPGVVQVVKIPQGVAVLAKDTWTARKGRDALRIEWDDSKAFKLGSAEILSRYRDLAQQPGRAVVNQGQADAQLQSPAPGSITLAMDFEFPYLAHAAMEPLNCVIQKTASGCEVWNGEQMQTVDQYALAQLFGIAPEQVKINTLFAGGSFGRRASKDADYVMEAAHIVKAAGTQRPVKMIWMREDDMRAGYFRPLFYHRLEAQLSADGQLLTWRHRLVGQSITTGSPFEAMLVKDGVDYLSVEGAHNLPYTVPNLKVELHTPTDIRVPVLWWRSVGSTHTAYSTEVFLDVIARKSGKDPVQLRLDLLRDKPRHAAVLKLAAQKAGWGSALPAKPGERRGRGVAVHESFHSYVAQIAEVTVKADGSIHVDRVVCAVDCGLAINPDVIKAQIEGSVGFGLSAALTGEITLKDGVVEQGNFDTYPVLRIGEMPRVETYILPSALPPTGIGEPGVPPIAPAVANAIAAATGRVLQQLPFKTEGLKA